MLDVGRTTAACIDGLPFLFLRVAAPFISSPLAHIFNLSLSLSFVPPQWKVGVITPVPKVASPASCSEFRPITVTPILSRILERIVVQSFLYSVLVHKAIGGGPTLIICFKINLLPYLSPRPTGSTSLLLLLSAFFTAYLNYSLPTVGDLYT